MKISAWDNLFLINKDDLFRQVKVVSIRRKENIFLVFSQPIKNHDIYRSNNK